MDLSLQILQESILGFIRSFINTRFPQLSSHDLTAILHGDVCCCRQSENAKHTHCSQSSNLIQLAEFSSTHELTFDSSHFVEFLDNAIADVSSFSFVQDSLDQYGIETSNSYAFIQSLVYESLSICETHQQMILAAHGNDGIVPSASSSSPSSSFSSLPTIEDGVYIDLENFEDDGDDSEYDEYDDIEAEAFDENTASGAELKSELENADVPLPLAEEEREAAAAVDEEDAEFDEPEPEDDSDSEFDDEKQKKRKRKSTAKGGKAKARTRAISSSNKRAKQEIGSVPSSSELAPKPQASRQINPAPAKPHFWTGEENHLFYELIKPLLAHNYPNSMQKYGEIAAHFPESSGITALQCFYHFKKFKEKSKKFEQQQLAIEERKKNIKTPSRAKPKPASFLERFLNPEQYKKENHIWTEEEDEIYHNAVAPYIEQRVNKIPWNIVAEALGGIVTRHQCYCHFATYKRNRGIVRNPILERAASSAAITSSVPLLPSTTITTPIPPFASLQVVVPIAQNPKAKPAAKKPKAKKGRRKKKKNFESEVEDISEEEENEVIY